MARIPLKPEAVALIEEQRAAFREKFGRDPRDDDPIFFDPDADTPQHWTEDDVETLSMDPRALGIGSFPRVIEGDESWITINARKITEIGAKRYLTKFLEVLDEAFEGFGPIGRPFTEDDDYEKVLMDPRGVGVGSFEPGVNRAKWINANVDLIKDMGAQQYLRAMLDVLRHDFGGEVGSPGPRRTGPVQNVPPWLTEATPPTPPAPPVTHERQRKQRAGFRPRDTLGLYSHILPTLVRMKKRGGLLRGGSVATLADGMIDHLAGSMVFDCRGLPLEFVADTGDAALEEMQATHEPVRLPFERCYFEFDHEIAILATVDEDSLTEITDSPANILEFYLYQDWSSPSFKPDIEMNLGEFYNDFTLESYQKWMDHNRAEDPVTEVPFFQSMTISSLESPAAARLLLGVLNLLQDKLLVSNHLKANPRPWLTQVRRERGQPPKEGDVRILTMNVPAIRNAASHTPTGTHESPALHWRRGHWRTLHRGTEDETKTWIKKFLVGDPSRGFITKNYRLIATMAPLIRTIKAEP